jgi:hypothetical protein
LRFEPSGAVDTSFGNGGETSAGHYPPLGLVIQSDGIIVVQSSSLLYRFFPDGSDAGGYRDLVGIIPARTWSYGMLKKLPDDRLLQSMSVSNNGPFFPYLLRLLP